MEEDKEKTNDSSNYNGCVKMIVDERMVTFIHSLETENSEILETIEKEALDTLESATYENINLINEVDRLNNIINELENDQSDIFEMLAKKYKSMKTKVLKLSLKPDEGIEYLK